MFFLILNCTKYFFFQAFNVEETIAMSSQVMNTNNVRIILEEILKVGNVQRSKLPRDIDDMSAADQVNYESELTEPEVPFRDFGFNSM